MRNGLISENLKKTEAGRLIPLVIYYIIHELAKPAVTIALKPALLKDTMRSRRLAGTTSWAEPYNKFSRCRPLLHPSN